MDNVKDKCAHSKIMLTTVQIIYNAPLAPTAEPYNSTTTTAIKRIVYNLTRPRLPRFQPPATNAETTALPTDTVIMYVTPTTVACQRLVLPR